MVATESRGELHIEPNHDGPTQSRLRSLYGIRKGLLTVFNDTLGSVRVKFTEDTQHTSVADVTRVFN
jgi:hypothetical protein